MRLPTGFATTFTIAASLVAGWMVSATVHAQVTLPAQGVPLDVQLAKQMADEVRRLADDITTDLGRLPIGRLAAEDARELAQTIDEYRQNRRVGADPLVIRRSYSTIQSAWEQLRAQLSTPGLATAVITRDLERIAAVNDRFARSVGANALPPEYYPIGPIVGPDGGGQIRRLARALVDRAEALAQVVREDLGRDPRAANLVADSARLARDADLWHDSLRPHTPPLLAARSFGSVDALGDRVGRMIQIVPATPRVVAAWNSYLSADRLVHKELGFPSKHPVVTVPVPGITLPVISPPVLPPPSVAVLADQLVNQTNEFVRVFGPGAGNVPEGRLMLAEAERLAAAAGSFRATVVRGGNPNALALSFRDVDAVWQRLARRVNRIAKGKTGPNIQQIARIGNTCEALHQSMGVPGFVPLILQ